MVYIRDVAHVRDGNPPQTNIVRVDGRRAIMMNVLKTGSASTLDIIKNVREIISSPSLKGQLPPQLKIAALSDQSIFVRSAISGVVREAIIAACLTAIMILIFLGSLAFHDHHRRLHSAFDSLLPDRARRAARDHQHHDPGRHGAGRGHSGRRRHRGHREHQPLSGDGPGAGAGHPGRLRADCHARSRLHARHLHRLRAHVLPERSGALPVCAHGRGGGLRHARQLLPVAHPRAHHGQVPAQGARRCAGGEKTSQPQPVHPLPARIRTRIRRFSPRLPEPAHLLRRSRGGLFHPLSGVCRGLAGTRAIARAGLLPLR